MRYNMMGGDANAVKDDTFRHRWTALIKEGDYYSAQTALGPLVKICFEKPFDNDKK